MYLETRYYNDGSAEAHLTKHRPVQDVDENTGKYDYVVEKIGGADADFGTLEEWIELLEIELDDIVALVLDLDAGGWVDITNYI